MIIDGDIYKRVIKTAKKFAPSRLDGISYDIEDGVCTVRICDGFKIIKYVIECKDAGDSRFVSPVLDMKCKADDFIDVSCDGEKVTVENLRTGDKASGLMLEDWTNAVENLINDYATNNQHLNISLSAGFLKAILEGLPNNARLDLAFGNSLSPVHFSTIIADNKKAYQDRCDIEGIICPIRK